MSGLMFLGGCYATPERHSVTESQADGGAMDAQVGDDGSVDGEVDGNGDGEVRPDGARVDAQPEASDACGGRCEGDTPVCTPGGDCVECSATDRGSCTEAEKCDTLTGTCVQCLQHTDCTEPEASVCDATTRTCKGCSESSTGDCDHIPGKNVCSEAVCVQCTRERRTACNVQVNPTTTAQYSCNALTNTCTTTALGTVPACGECVSNDECTSGNACVQTEFVDQPIADKWFCQPIRTGVNCTLGRPYIKNRPSTPTVDGSPQNVCGLRVSTCAAHRNYSNTFCGLDATGQQIPLVAGVPAEAAVQGDNTLCGAFGLEDGFCIEADTGTYRCTVGCINADLGDCPVDATSCSSRSHATGSRSLCWQ